MCAFGRFTDTQAWRTHWDYQLYKALEHQYQRGLESLNENLSEIKVEVVFKNKRLQFRPPMEQVRAAIAGTDLRSHFSLIPPVGCLLVGVDSLDVLSGDAQIYCTAANFQGRG